MRMLSLVALVMMSCGTTTPPPVETLYEEIHVEGAVEKTTASMSVQGMMCEVGSVAKVRKELLEVPGVASAMIDFDKDRSVNFANIEFDPATVSAEDLVAKVTAIGDGMYPVPKMEVTHVGAPQLIP